MTSIMFHDGNRTLQDAYDSRRIADRLEEKLTRTAFTADDKAFVGSQNFTNGGLNNNRELGEILDDADGVKKLVETFKSDQG